MKNNEILPIEYIDDNNVVYNVKMEGYATWMSYMNELYAISPIKNMEE